MKDKLIQLDKFLAMLEVKGDNVFILAQARQLAKEIYDSTKESDVNG